MSDRFAAEIFIGGELSEKMLPDFIETIENEVGSFEGVDENTTPIFVETFPVSIKERQ